MALLNKELGIGFDFVRTDRINLTNPLNFIRHDDNCLIWLIRTWNDRDYFYIEIFQGNAFQVYPIDTLVPADILEKIKTDDHTYLYICNTHEAFLDIVEPLYESLVIEAGIPPKKIYISNEAADLGKAVKKYADNNGLEYMNVEWVLEFEYSISTQAQMNNAANASVLYPVRNYPKRFLNFNRRWRLHRPTLVALLKAKGLLDKGYVSLAPSDDGRDWNHMWPWILSHHRNDPEITELLTKHESDIINMPPMYLDTDELVENRAILEKRSFNLYRDTLVSVVSETTFYHGSGMNEARFLSEKIFKPIAMGHPFIFVTVPKSLELLRELGYKTFHPIIDESYDDEFDDCERLKKIVKEIERISNFSQEEVKEFCIQAGAICKHNQQVILEKTEAFRYGRDPECKILHKNFVRTLL